MKYYELTNTVYLYKDIYFTKANEMISNFINEALYLNNQLSKFHKKNEFKGYVYDSLFPRENDKTYKKGSIYVFRIRSINKELLTKLEKLLKKINSEYMKLIATELKVFKPKFINSIYTATPAIVTLENGYWTKNEEIEILIDRIIKNTVKKYKHFIDEDIPYDFEFFKTIEIENMKPIAIEYKDIKLLGNKFKLEIKEDELSQNISNLLLGTGILEKNSSIGAGYCIPRYI
ncbi:CRISPR-associated endoribonuclease Cas6 [Senegalia massiliensis]|uniref:CRISPR-associated endoribonuclease Cas6 n=1 Tax=Senegalia massiliensis TaxID=1720316 RepID=UPI001031B245|nr:CRISPR-associated endoribonuclease Cas6 [Senegalia massiliensis]